MTDAPDEPREDEIEHAATTGPDVPVEAPSDAAPAYQEPALDELLDEYDQSIAARQPAVAPQPGIEQQPELFPWQREAQAADPSIEAREQALAYHVQQQMQQAHNASELREFGKVVEQLNEAVADIPHLPKGYAEDWLIARAMRDVSIRQAWDLRNSPRLDRATKQMIAGRLRSVMNEFVEAARSLPDPIVTADVNAVAAAVRSAGGDRNYREPAPNFGTMSEGEFRRHVRERHGYDPMMGG